MDNRFHLSLTVGLAVSLGAVATIALSPQDAVGYPAGAVVSLGTNPVWSFGGDAYSGFVDSDLEHKLITAGIKRIFVGGLATDYVVLNTVIDSLDIGIETYVLVDAVSAMDIEPGDGLRALHLMQSTGATLITISDLLTND